MSGNFWTKLFFVLSTFSFLQTVCPSILPIKPTAKSEVHPQLAFEPRESKSQWRFNLYYYYCTINIRLEQDLTVRAVHKILNHLENHPETINEDVLFGVVLAKSNLNWLIDRCRSIPSSLLIEVFEIVRKCDKILEEYSNSFITALSTVWENGAENLNYGNLLLDEDNFALPKFEDCQNIQDYIMKNIPEYSNECIKELFDSDCQPSVRCWPSERGENDSVGYATTHLLMYLQIARRLNCHVKNKKFFDVKLKIERFCRSMLMEAKAFHDRPYFSLVRDLFLEEMALCGVEGYAEFAPKAWRQEVLRWQSDNGCFEHDTLCSADSSSNPSKRTDYFIDGCHTHVTAVALATLAFHLSYLRGRN